MYAEFYGLRELPFALTPDPRYIYFTPSHTEVMANLHYGVESGKGLIVVTGEVGTGKTTILRWMMQRLDRTVLVTIPELLTAAEARAVPRRHKLALAGGFAFTIVAMPTLAFVLRLTHVFERFLI